MKPLLIWISVFLGTTIILLGCANNLVQTREFGTFQNCQQRLLIGTQKSEFKEAVVDKMTRDLNQDYCFIKRVDVAALNREPADAYKAIAILSPLKMGTINSDAEDFMEKMSKKEKLVVLVTTGGKGKTVELDQVDAISSASNLVDADTVASKLIERISHVVN